MTFHIARLMRDELTLTLDWAAAEGWNPGLHDAPCFAAADRSGFFVGRVDDEPVAIISVVKYGESFAFLGLYIVKPSFRGRGHGIALWNAALATARDRNIGLDGVVAQQDNYKRSGFVFAYRNVRYRGVGGAGHAIDARIVPLTSVRFSDLAAYDETMFGAARQAFLQCWTVQPESKALAVIRDGRIAGYGVLRRCRHGYKIGPLFADDAGVAEALFDALAMYVPEGTDFFVDVPEPNRAAVALAERHSMCVVFDTARMYTGTPPPIRVERVFGVTTFELG